MKTIRKTKVGDIITLSDTTNMLCIGRGKKAIVTYVYEDDNSAFVIDNRGQVRGLVHLDDYYYEENTNEEIKKKLAECIKNAPLEKDDLAEYSDVEKGDLVEIINPQFCLNYGLNQQYIVLERKEKMIWILDKDGEVKEVVGGYKKINSSNSVFKSFWNKRMRRIEDRDRHIEAYLNSKK